MQLKLSIKLLDGTIIFNYKMNCFNCQKLFDQKTRTPRLLIFCGHSLCQNCCEILFCNNKIVCPQCKVNTFCEKIHFLPKNLALISNNFTIGQQQTQIKQCYIHNKKYEAFCSKQKILICIDCILYDGHKNHEMDSVKNSYNKEIGTFNSKVQNIQKFIMQIRQKAQINKQNQQISRNNYFEAKQQINNFYKQIKMMIELQESTILAKIQESFQINQGVFQNKNQQFQIKLNEVSRIMDQCQKFVAMLEIDFLQSTLKRDKQFQTFKFQSLQVGKPNTFSYPKNTLVDNLVKSLNQSKQNANNQNKANNHNIINVSSAHEKKVKPNVNEPGNNIKGVRKNPISSINVSNSQQNNSKVPKKISMKKQSIPFSNQNQCSGITLVANLQQKNKSYSLGVHNSNINQKQKPLRQAQDKQKQKVSKNKKSINKIQAFQYQTDLSTVHCRQSQSLCNSFMSNMTSFLSQKKVNSIYLIGGFNQESNNIVKLSLNTMKWENVMSLQTNRSKFGAIALNKQIYMFGGKKGKQRLSDVQALNIQTNKIKKCCSMSNNRSGFGIVSVGDLIFIIGGNDGQNILNTVQTYNIKTNEWKRKESMNDNRDQLAVIVGDNKIYAIGGFGGLENQPLKSVQYFDLSTQKWSYLPSMNYSRRALSAAFLADGVYAIGGFNGTSYMKSVERYEQGDDKWIEVSQMNVARCTHSSISLFQSQQIYVFGGFDYFPLDAVQRYSLITNQWQKISQMPAARFMHSTVVIKQQ